MHYQSLANVEVCSFRTAERPIRLKRRFLRNGVAAVELALTLPLLAFLFVIATDFARVYYVSLTLHNAARAGALYAADPIYSAESRFGSAQEAALADATNISPTPQVSTRYLTSNSGGNIAEVTLTYTFETVTQFPGVPSQITLQRSVQVAVAPSIPNQL